MEKIFENEILPIIKKRKGIDLKIIKGVLILSPQHPSLQLFGKYLEKNDIK